jgi:hypothetical protein
LTGIATSPNEIVREAMARALLGMQAEIFDRRARIN